MLNDKPLSASNICKIIRECARCGVSKISFQGLQLNFISNEAKEVPSQDFSYEKVKAVNVSQETLEKEQEYDFITNELEAKEEEATQLLIEDPVAYENLMLHEDIQDNGAAIA